MNSRIWRLGLVAGSVMVLGLGKPAPVFADGPSTEGKLPAAVHVTVPLTGQVCDNTLQECVTLSGAARVLVVFEPNGDRPGGGCIHVLVLWNDVSGIGAQTNWDGRGVSQVRFPVADLSQGQFSFPASFDLVADRPGGGCIMVNAAITLILEPEGVVNILIGL